MAHGRTQATKKELGGEQFIIIEAVIFVAIQQTDLKLTFDIGNADGYQAHDSVLLAEIGQNAIGLGLTDKASRRLYRLVHAQGTNREGGLLTEMLKAYPEFTGSFSQVAISYRFPNCALVPSTLYRFQDEALYLASSGADFPGQVLKSDHLPNFGIQTVYGLPKSLNIAVTRQYLRHQYWHHHAVLLKTLAVPTGNRLFIDFRPADFSVCLMGDNGPLLCNIFSYSAPADVLYRLIQICRDFDLSREEVELEISGFVDEKSALYRELYAYFTLLNFSGDTEALNYSEALSEYPIHYFASISKLAACVSFQAV